MVKFPIKKDTSSRNIENAQCCWQISNGLKSTTSSAVFALKLFKNKTRKFQNQSTQTTNSAGKEKKIITGKSRLKVTIYANKNMVGMKLFLFSISYQEHKVEVLTEKDP